MSKSKNTPVRKQYLDIKRQHPEAIVFFRLGDFYETFDEDAKTVSKVLDIVLTSRNAGGGVRVPMAGIPHHAAENYLSRLIDAGHHVAICEQVGDHPVNGLMPRDVVRVVTPGTILEQSLLPGDANNYLVCIVVAEKRAGVAYVDITTGEFAVTELRGGDIRESVRAELLRLRPAETLFPDTLDWSEDPASHYTSWPAWRFEEMRCESILKEQFEVNALEGFGVRGLPLAIRAAGAVVQYLAETRPEALKLLSSLSTYSLQEFMTLDAATRRNLELTETIRKGTVAGSLLGVLDCTVTPMGKRLLRQWVSKPLLDVAAIRKRHQGVGFFFSDGLLRAEMREALQSLNDLERLVNRVAGGTAQPRDLVAIRDTLERLPNVRELLPTQPPENFPLAKLLSRFTLCENALGLLSSAIQENPPATVGHLGIIRQGYAEELDEIMESTRHAREWIADLEAVEQARTGINSLKVSHNKVYGYYIEVTKSKTDLVPDDYIRKQTLVNAERYVTPELKEYETKVLNAEEQIQEIERRLFYDVCKQLARHAKQMLETARVLAHWDTLAALAETATLNGYVCPEVLEEDVLDVRDGRHPVVEHTLAGQRFVPNDTVFEEGERVRIITGPNMSGKSTALRQVALIALLAQMGSFVPAKSARIGLIDRIFTRIGAQDEIHAGQSTFMVEMVEMANILNHATPRSLLVLDEVGRGTSTYDGVAIAWAVVEYLHNHPQKKAKTLFATHYHELTQLSDFLPGVRNYNVAVSEADGEVVFLYNIVPGGADQSYGIHVAQLAGMPAPVVQRAEEIMRQLEKSSGKAVKIDPQAPQQMALFPETNPLVEELEELDLSAMSPIEALNRLYEWQKRYTGE